MCVRELFVQIPRLHVLQLLSCDSDSDAARYCANEQWHWLTSAENCHFTTVTTHVFTWLISFELVFESYRHFSSFPCLNWSKLNMTTRIEIHCSLIWFANTLGLTVWVDYDSEWKDWHFFVYSEKNNSTKLYPMRNLGKPFYWSIQTQSNKDIDLKFLVVILANLARSSCSTVWC